MKKIPTLFVKLCDEKGRYIGISRNVTPGMEWVLNGEGIATIKYDGACCAIIDGKFYKRFDAKNGRKIPDDAIPCQEVPDPITDHWPHWVAVDSNNPADKWFIEAFKNTTKINLCEGTYEAVGPHFQNNPYNFILDCLIPHGKAIVEVEKTYDGKRTYDSIVDFLNTHEIEGLVFWKDGEPKCKIKRSDFGFEWPIKKSNRGN